MVEVCAVFCYLPLVARCLDTIDVCISRMFVVWTVCVCVCVWECLLCSCRC